MKDFYYILGLDADCSLDEIKEAYRKLSKKLHPDLNQGDEFFENRFKDVKEAFETLRDPLKRKLYDAEPGKFNSGKAESDTKRQVPGQESPRATYGAYGQSHQTRRGKIKKRRLGVGLSLTLMVVALILGVYLFRSFTGSGTKMKPVYKDTVAVAPVISKQHKHKHYAKNLVAGKTEKKTFDTASIVAVKPDAMKPMPDKPESVKAVPGNAVPLQIIAVKTQTDSGKTHNDYLYATYVHPNVTGIVQMREQGSFGAPIIASIPANSRVLVLERGNTYYRICYEKSIGFVPKWSLMEK